MTAAQLVEPGRFELVRVGQPEPDANQVRVQLEGCGVCASNLPVWSGRPWFSYPLAPGQLGHEGWGRVEALGAGVERDWLGCRVAVLSEHAYAEFDTAAVNDLVPLPEHGLDVAPVEPFGCLFNIIERCAIRPEDTVAVVGLGFIGRGLVRLAVQAGARVVALSANAGARQDVLGLGVEEALGLEGEDRASVLAEARERIGTLTGGRGCTRVIECTGYQAPLDLCGDIVAQGGRLIIAGYHQDGARQVDLQQWNWKGIDVINAHERDPARIRGGMRKAVDALAADPAWVRTMITHRFPLDELDAALSRTSDRPPGFVKGAVVTGRTDP